MDGAYCVAVTDQGIGISPADLQHIFEPFYRSAAARRMATGTRLGLPLINAITAWHGGKVWVDAQPGHTSFYLQLPAYS